MATCVTRELSDGSIRHLVRFREGGRGGTQRSVPFDGPKAAERFRKLVEAHGNRMPDDETLRRSGFAFLIAGTRHVEGEGADIALVRYALDYIDTLEVDAETAKKYRNYVRDYLIPHFGEMLLVTPARADMRAWQRWMTGTLGLAPKTVRNVRGSVLIPMFNRSCQRGEKGEPALRDYSPMDGLEPPKAVPYNREFLRTVEDARLLFTTAYELDADAADLIYVTAQFANRWGEASAIFDDACFLGARNPYVEIRRKAVAVAGQGIVLKPGAKTKAGDFRRVPVGASVGAVLARRCGYRRGLLFPNGAGTPWRHGNFYRDRWQPIMAEARARGLRYDLTLHGLRKSTLTLAAELGVDPVTLQEFAGHAHASTTLQIYTGVSGRGHAALIDAVGGFYPSPAGAA